MQSRAHVLSVPGPFCPLFPSSFIKRSNARRRRTPLLLGEQKYTNLGTTLRNDSTQTSAGAFIFGKIARSLLLRKLFARLEQPFLQARDVVHDAGFAGET